MCVLLSSVMRCGFGSPGLNCLAGREDAKRPCRVVCLRYPIEDIKSPPRAGTPTVHTGTPKLARVVVLFASESVLRFRPFTGWRFRLAARSGPATEGYTTLGHRLE